MIASLRGCLISRERDHVVIEAGGVGYEVFVTSATAALLPDGQEIFLHVAESFGMYGAGATLYGFPSVSEKALFCSFRDNVPSTGAKKALEYLDKASKSLPDFRRAILEKDLQILTGVFGFSKKTAEKLAEGLKDKLESVPISGAERLARAESFAVADGTLSQALAALSALGYKPSEARAALQSIAQESGGRTLPVEQIVRQALKRL